MKDIATISSGGLAPIRNNPGYSALAFAALAVIVPLTFWGLGGVLGVTLGVLSLLGIPAIGGFLAKRANVTNQFLAIFMFAATGGYGVWFFLNHGLIITLLYTFLACATMFTGTAVGTNKALK